MPAQVSFSYVDFDFYEPIKIALEFLDEVTLAGAVIIVDDYDHFLTGVKTAIQGFLRERPNYALSIPDARYGCLAVLAKTAARSA